MQNLLTHTLALAIIIAMAGCSKTPNIGLRDGNLLPCPGKPNCVSSQAKDDGHRIDPIPYGSGKKEALDRLVSLISGMKRANIITKSDDYLHAEFRSALFRFVDDVEFLFDGGSKMIHVRSASRVGYSDMGVNRKRVEEIRRLFTQKE